ncbi:hypothetical protein Q5705_09620 [Kosakonia sp. H02]|nr:hypothetical protein Q5705_09620 [Kosakonia sp. H02]
MNIPRVSLCRFLIFAALYTLPVMAQEEDMLSALDVADNAVFSTEQHKALNMLFEAASAINQHASKEQRLSLDMRWDTTLRQGWRLRLSNRLDSRFSHRLSETRHINTLREAWLSYQLTSRTTLDMGRINTRYGVALGYNPTDFLGRGTVRSATSADPETLRTNRQGNAMVRLQHFWDNASVTALWSPEIRGGTHHHSASLDWHASNPRERLLLSASYRFAENFNPQFLLFQERQRKPQFGVNLSRVLTRSTLIYGEWAGGRQPYNWQETLPESQWDVAWRNRVATGMTWTGENQLTLRLEGHYNGSAQPIPGGLEPRRSALVQAYWKDILDQYDLNLIAQRDLQQHNNMGFAELRRHLGALDLALQWQKVYLSDEAERRWQFSLDYWF